MKKILVPLDGSEFSEKILDHIEVLAKKANAEIILLRVVPFSWPSEFIHVREMGDKMDKEASDYLFSIESKLEEKGIKGEVCVNEGNVPEVICNVAREKGVNLIAMSTHGRGVVKKWALGSVADKVSKISHIPVLLYRSTGEDMPDSHYKNILIPLDGSHLSESILPRARHLVELFEAKVWFLHVINTSLAESFTVLKDCISEREEEIIEKIRSYFSTLEKRIKETGTSYELVIEKGNPAETIFDFASENEIDLIAMSTHGHGGISSCFLGNVANKVVQSSSKPVLLIRAVEESEGA
ncbi:MAG: universal stress protein [Deltaproteobacteria bacterium]|nr:universal stress protein [Deltaproteobacteria bacterium]